MASRLTGEIPGLPFSLAKLQINDALNLIYDEILWSFQLQTSGWLTPGLQFPVGPGNSAGTITVNPGDITITGDANASAAWIAYSGPTLFTQLQIRTPYYSLYNIVATDPTIPTAVVLTIDRPWGEPPQLNGTYMIYQAYFPAPVPDFRRFFDVRDTTNAYPLDYWSYSQKDLSVRDPERVIFDDPTHVVPYQTDQRAGSSTLGQMLYELWPHPLSVLPYTFDFLRRGPQLVSNSDTVPYPLNEEVVLWRAKEVAYLYAEAQKGQKVTRGSGADYRFLAGAANKEYARRVKQTKDLDRDLYDMYWNRLVRGMWPAEPYATVLGGLNIGRF